MFSAAYIFDRSVKYTLVLATDNLE